ncbi:MAG: hypothetical protein A3H91_07470 [Gammaproteobacteria bacterium RIFCSPLOWO2_02_FULL_61_13]|nr:MAG: hypothetical protein A3H91_07470 [Gammaproteobacteria bacterium RIFCSPLOWO2_02_FULL_61_13]
MKKFLLIFLTLAMVLAINLPEGMLAQVGASPNILLAALVALVIAGLIANEHFGLVIVVVGVAVAANAPQEMADSIGYSREVMMAVLVGLVLLPFVARQL